jgi:hypothetical protein
MPFLNLSFFSVGGATGFPEKESPSPHLNRD